MPRRYLTLALFAVAAWGCEPDDTSIPDTGSRNTPESDARVPSDTGTSSPDGGVQDGRDATSGQTDATPSDTGGVEPDGGQGDASVGNARPVAVIGPDQNVNKGTTVTLDGSRSSDPDGDTITYQWFQLTGPNVALSSSTNQMVTFEAPDMTVTLTFRLVVRDAEVASEPDEISIFVRNRNPVARTGPDRDIFRRSLVFLDGRTSSDPDGDELMFRWTQMSGPPITINGDTTSQPSFTAPAMLGPIEILLIVRDPEVSSVPTVLTLNVVNRPPTADAGPDMVAFKRSNVIVDGTGSRDPDFDMLRFMWSQTAGAMGMFADPADVRAVFTTPGTSGLVELQIVVSDDMVSSAPDTMTIDVRNRRPVADSGPAQTVTRRATVQLDGTASTDDDMDLLTYQWAQLSGPAVVFDDATLAQPRFTAPDSSGDLQFTLQVSDGEVSSLSSTVTVTVFNRTPTANAGADRRVTLGRTVTADGSDSSDPDTDTLLYAWIQLSGPQVQLMGADTARPSFTAPNAVGTVELQLVVSDGEATSAPDTVVFDVSNRSPQIVVSDVSANAGEIVSVDASGTSDADGDRLTYVWRQLSGPPVELEGADGPVVTLVAVVGVVELELSVRDALSEVTAPAMVTGVTYSGPTLTLSQLPFQNTSTTTSLAVDEPVRVMHKDGDRLFVADTSFVRIFDVSNPRAPVELGTYPPIAPVEDLDVEGDRMYLAIGPTGIDVVNIANPAMPSSLGTYFAPTRALGVTVVGTRVYMGDQLTGIVVVDLAVPQQPGVLGGYFNRYVNPQLVSAGTTIYVADSMPDLEVLDFTAPANPQLLGMADSAQLITRIHVEGDVLYAVTNTGTWRAYDVSNGATLLSESQLAVSATARDVDVDGGRLYISAFGPGVPEGSGVFVYDVTDPAAPVALGVRAVGNAPSEMVVHRGFAFVATTDDVQIIDVETELGPAGAQIPGQAHHVDGADGLLAISAGIDGVRILDVSTATAPIERGAVPGIGDVREVQWTSTIAFARSDALHAIDSGADGATQVRLLNRYAPMGPLLDAHVAGAVGYALTPMNLEISNVVGTSTPTPAGMYGLTQPNPRHLVVGDARAYIGGGTIEWLDLTNPLSPQPGGVVMVAPESIDAKAGLLHAATLGQVQIFDARVQGVLTPLSTYPMTPSTIRHVHVTGPRAFVASWYDGLYVYDLSNPAAPRLSGHYSTPGAAVATTVSRSHAFVASQGFGVTVLPANGVELSPTYTTAPAQALVGYSVRWPRVDTSDVEVECTVTGGTCQVVTVVQQTSSASLRWALPMNAGDHELQVVVGNARYFVRGIDRVTVQ